MTTRKSPNAWSFLCILTALASLGERQLLYRFVNAFAPSHQQFLVPLVSTHHKGFGGRQGLGCQWSSVRPSTRIRSSKDPNDSSLSSGASVSVVENDDDDKSNDIASLSVRGLDNCASLTQARRLLEKQLLNDRPKVSGVRDRALFRSISIPPGASVKGITDGDLAIQTRMVNKKYNIMELIELSGDRDADRASVAVICIFFGSTLSALTANQNLPGPEIIRFLVVWLFSFAPLFFVGYGIADVEGLQALLVTIQRNIFPVYRKRMIQHEAGHFLMGHLLGWPVKGYATNAVKNAVEFYSFSDSDRASDRSKQLGFDKPLRVETETLETRRGDVPFFSDEGRGSQDILTQSVFRREADNNSSSTNPMLKLPSQEEPSTSWPFRGFDDATLDQLAVVSVAGVCAEILAFGNAEGGVADFSQLRQIFSSADEEMTDREVDNRIRFALGFTVGVLRQHLGALDALAGVMERGGTVEECVLAIETCNNVSGQDGILGDYEVRRREAFRSDGVGLVEKIFLGRGKNLEAEEDRLVEGKGGGYRKQKFQLTGDDPLYAALALSLAFFVWASSGGLSLH